MVVVLDSYVEAKCVFEAATEQTQSQHFCEPENDVQSVLFERQQYLAIINLHP